jgi:predicted PurR-regulated permease PerM
VPRAILLFWLGWIGVGIVTWGFSRLRELILLLLVAQFLAFAMEPPVNRLVARGWRRGAATGVVMIGVMTSLILFMAAIGSLLVTQASALIDRAPEILQNAEDWINSTFDASVDLQGWIDRLNDKGGPLQQWASQVAGQSWSIGSKAAGIVLQLLSVGLFAFYFCADGPRLRRALFARFPPHRQKELARAFNTAIEKTGGYLNSSPCCPASSTSSSSRSSACRTRWPSPSGWRSSASSSPPSAPTWRRPSRWWWPSARSRSWPSG